MILLIFIGLLLAMAMIDGADKKDKEDLDNSN